MNKIITWSAYDDFGTRSHGEMPLQDVPAKLNDLRAQAIEYLKSSNADHVIYGRKMLDPDGNVIEVKFYMIALSDKGFYSACNKCSDSIIYAVHRRS